jgi:hypothetical protein
VVTHIVFTRHYAAMSRARDSLMMFSASLRDQSEFCIGTARGGNSCREAGRNFRVSICKKREKSPPDVFAASVQPTASDPAAGRWA